MCFSHTVSNKDHVLRLVDDAASVPALRLVSENADRLFVPWLADADPVLWRCTFFFVNASCGPGSPFLVKALWFSNMVCCSCDPDYAHGFCDPIHWQPNWMMRFSQPHYLYPQSPERSCRIPSCHIASQRCPAHAFVQVNRRRKVLTWSGGASPCFLLLGHVQGHASDTFDSSVTPAFWLLAGSSPIL